MRKPTDRDRRPFAIASDLRTIRERRARRWWEPGWHFGLRRVARRRDRRHRHDRRRSGVRARRDARCGGRWSTVGTPVRTREEREGQRDQASRERREHAARHITPRHESYALLIAR